MNKVLIVLLLGLALCIGFFLYSQNFGIKKFKLDNTMLENVELENSKSKTVVSECDYDNLSEIINKYISLTNFDNTYWKISSSSPVINPEPLAGVQGGDFIFSNCGYEVVYTNDDDTFEDDLSYSLQETLLADGWSDDASIKFISDSTGGSTAVSLLHADGPTASRRVFMLPYYEDRTVQFASVNISYMRSKWKEMLDGESETPCPCSREVSLTILEPFSMAEYLKGSD